MQNEFQDEIDEILTDAYGDDEQMSGWECAFSDGIELPFSAALLGIPVEVQGFRANYGSGLQCEILREGKRRWIGVGDLDAEGLPADFLHLLKLYRVWAGGDY